MLPAAAAAVSLIVPPFRFNVDTVRTSVLPAPADVFLNLNWLADDVAD